MTFSGTFPESLEVLKLHGMGNDFLVLLDLDGSRPIDGAMARSLCDRHRGIGADGLIRACRSAGPAGAGPAFRMELLNADGSPAETSGNGLRCLALALVLAGAVPAGPGAADLVIDTVAGPRRARVGPVGEDGSAAVSVEMGSAGLGEELEVGGHRARLVDLGNPHVVVLVDDPDAVDLPREGAAEEARHPGGINVNFASALGRERIRLRTWERGAGSTLACGSGSCATAAALRDWGLVAERVEVASPGGSVEVELGGEGIVLTGPAQLVGAVRVGLGALAAGGVSACH